MTPARRDNWSGSWPEHRPRRPGPGPKRPRRQPFGATWWGRAWVDALEQRASLDPNRLPRGRTYARGGAVGELQLDVGKVTAPVQGSRPAPYRVRTFDDAGWAAVLDAFAATIGHTAALLDGELPPEVATDAAGAGFDLLPGPGEIQPRCTCPDWADPCKHAAAVCYLVADALDADPFGILLLRGRPRAEVLAELRARRTAPADGGAGAGTSTAQPLPTAEDPGVPAAAWHRNLPAAPADALDGRADTAHPGNALPRVPLPPSHPGRPRLLVGEPPPGVGVDLAGLRAVAADAAARALHLASGDTAHGVVLPVDADLARRAAASLGPTPTGTMDVAELAPRANVPARQLLRRALAWQAGGPGGLGALDDLWDPGPVAMAEGRSLVGGRGTVRRNRVTAGDRQLRLGRDGRWYPYRRASDRGWDPDGPGTPARHQRGRRHRRPGRRRHRMTRRPGVERRRLDLECTRSASVRRGELMSNKIDKVLAEEGAAAENADIPDELPENVEVTRPNLGRATVVSVRLSAEEHARLQHRAKEANLPVSTLLRIWALDRLRGDDEGDAASVAERLNRLERAVFQQSA